MQKIPAKEVATDREVFGASDLDQSLKEIKGKKFMDFVNVKDFGAVGDGVTDDTEAIQDAIDSLTNKSVIYFPKGLYKTTDTLINNGLASFVGESIQDIVNDNQFKGSVIKYTGNSTALKFGKGSDVSGIYSHCYIDTLGFYGTNESEIAIDISGMIRWRITNIFIDNFQNGIGIKASGQSYIGKLDGGRIRKCGIGIHFTKDFILERGEEPFNAIEICGQLEVQVCDYGIILGNHLSSPEGKTDHIGHGSSIHNITIEGCNNIGLWVLTCETVSIRDIYFEKNNDFSLKIGKTDRTKPNNIILDTAHFIDTEGSGIQVIKGGHIKLNNLFLYSGNIAFDIDLLNSDTTLNNYRLYENNFNQSFTNGKPRNDNDVYKEIIKIENDDVFIKNRDTFISNNIYDYATLELNNVIEDYNGIFRIRFASLKISEYVQLTDGIEISYNTALTGTSGTNGKITLSLTSDNLYIENRTGNSIRLFYSIKVFEKTIIPL